MNEPMMVSARASAALRGAVRPLALLIVGLALAGTGMAQEPKKAPPQNPVGGNWGKPNVQPNAEPAARVLDAKQLETLKRISTYFNDLNNLKGRFTQTGADKKVAKGRFYVKRPGRLRFDYAPPHKMLIISDGKNLHFQDLDLETDDPIPLDQTAFRLLLKKDVDLLRDAQIFDLQEADDLIVITLADKNPDAAGRIRLFLTKRPQLELKEWVTSDAQGLDTRVELSELVKTEEIDAAIFKIQPLGLKKKLQGSGGQ